MAFDGRKALSTIAGGEDQPPFRFMWNFLVWVHDLDDLIDRDKPVDPIALMQSHLCLISTLSDNSFYQEHKKELFPLIVTGALAHLESERFAKSEDVLRRITSQVIKSQYQDVFFYVAFLVGGFGHMMEMSRQFRDYHFDPTPPPEAST